MLFLTNYVNIIQEAHGRIGEAVNTPDCGSGMQGFDPLILPQIDKYLKDNSQGTTIGIIVCKKDNRYLIEYSSDKRIRITTYTLV